MIIEMTEQQAIALEGGDPEDVRLFDPRTNRCFRLVPEDDNCPYDDTPWTVEEMNFMAMVALTHGDDADNGEALEAP